jgi:hypothetical protein
MPAVTRALAAFGVAIACIVHFGDAQAAPPKKPRTVVSKKKEPKKAVEKAEPATAPAAAEPPPEPAPPPLPATDPKPEAPPKKDESSAASSAAAPPTPAQDKPALFPVPKSKTLEPLHIDLKATGNADALLAFIGVGAAADVGIVRGGPGVFALGAAGEYDFCATVCWLFSAITPLEFSQSQISLWGRASYHIDIKGKGLEKIDVFPFIMVGPTFARSNIKLDNGAAEYRGKDTAIAGGAGLGANLFVAGPLFVGAEARFRYAQGVYQYELVYGNERVIDGSAYRWSTTGIDVLFAMGGRF